MSQARFFQTGLPYLIVALLMVASIIYVETLFENTVDVSHAIKITAVSADRSETLENTVPLLDSANKDVALLLKQITLGQQPIEKALNSDPFAALDPTELPAILSSAAHVLSQKHDFVNAERLLSQLSLDQRLTHGVQFTFAYTLSKTGRQNDAIEQYKLYTNAHPNIYAAILNRGLLLKKAGAYKEAIVVLSDAVEKSSGYKKAKALASIASSEYQLSLYPDAIKHYKKAIEYRPSNPHTWAQLSKALSASGAEYQQIIDSNDKAIALNQQDYRPQLAKAKRQLQHYDYSGVINTLKAAHLKPNDLTTRRLLAWAYLEQGKRNNAKKHIRYLIRHEKSRPDDTSAKLMLLYVNKHYKKLISTSKKLRNKSNETRYLNALAYRKMGLYKKSMTLLDKLANSSVYRWRSRVQIARIKRSRQQYANAASDYQDLVQHNSTVAFLPFELSLTHESLAQGAPALKSIEHALSINTANKTYKLAKVRYLHLLGKSNQALQEINALLAANPHYVRGLRLKAEMQIALNKPYNAIETFETIIALQPSDTSTLKDLSELLIDRKQYKRAQSYLTKLLIEQSDSIDARYLLAYSLYMGKQLTLALTELNNILKLNQQHQLAKELKHTINTELIS